MFIFIILHSLLDIEIPLMGEQQFMETNILRSLTKSSPATVDLLASCRPKIYALLQLLNMRHKEAVTIANEHYRMCNEKLKVEDQVVFK